METINLRKMVHSVYGWEERSHTSPKVGDSHPSKKRKNTKKEKKLVVDSHRSHCFGSNGEIFEGPRSRADRRRATLTHCHCASERLKPGDHLAASMGCLRLPAAYVLLLLSSDDTAKNRLRFRDAGPD